MREAHVTVTSSSVCPCVCVCVGILLIAKETGDGAFHILPSDLYFKKQNKIKAHISKCVVRGSKSRRLCVCMSSGKRDTERHRSPVVYNGNSTGCWCSWWNELACCSAHSNIRITSMQTHTCTDADNTQRITKVAEISTKHVAHTPAHSDTGKWKAYNLLIIASGLSWRLCVNTYTYDTGSTLLRPRILLLHQETHR